MSAYKINETIVAPITANGIGAIGVIRVSGNKSIEIASVLLRKEHFIRKKTHTLTYGYLFDGGEKLDEVVVALFRAPRSFTKEDVVEISCHGSPFIIQKIIEAIIKNGARMAQPGEFTLRAFLNGRIDLTQAEAVADLIASETASSRDIALQQMKGGFSQEINALRQELIDFAALLELELDFGEEDVEFADRTKLIELITKIITVIKNLLGSFQLGNVIKSGVNTVIAGRPNAGKSTLLNSLLKEERAIVSDIAGTTRDVIEETLNIKGLQFRLIDTAGIRQAENKIEAIGIEKTFEKVEKAAILLYLYDAANISAEDLKMDIDKLERDGLKMIKVANKIDLINNSNIRNEVVDFADIKISAKHPDTFQLVKDLLYSSVIEAELSTDQTIVSNARHYEALNKALERLTNGLENIHSGISSDLVALEIRQALHYLGEITGAVTTDDLLDSIFTRFCIGK